MRQMVNGTPCRSTVAVGLVCVCALASVDCSSHRPYPKAWPAVLAGTQPCESLSGTYRNRNDTSSGFPTLLTLARILPRGASLAPLATEVTLSFPAPGQMNWIVSAAQNQLDSVTLTRDAKRYFCRDGRVTIRNTAWSWGGELLGGASRIRESVTVELHLSDDYLVIGFSHKYLSICIRAHMITVHSVIVSEPRS